jgi:hypothetical protein
VTDTMPVEPSDDELVRELRRVRSDLGFRKWIGTRVRVVIALLVFDLIVSCLSIGAFVAATNALHSACVRDDTLRAAYTAQWQPILDGARTQDDPRNRDIVARFQVGLDGFKQHGCSQANIIRVAVIIVIVVAVVTVLGLVVRWLVLRRRRRRVST